MDMFPDARYNTPYSKYPVSVHNGQRIFLQAEVKSSDAGLVVFLDTCKMTPTDNYDDPTNYVFIEKG